MKRLYTYAGLLLLFALSVGAEQITLQVNLAPEKVQLQSEQGFTQVLCHDRRSLPLAQPGEPDIPALQLHVLVPRDAFVSQVRYTRAEAVELGSHKLYPFQGYYVLSKKRPDFIQPLSNIYRSNQPYPQTPVVRQGHGFVRGYNLYSFTYTPFSYEPQSGRLLFYPVSTITVDYVTAGTRTADYPAHRMINAVVQNTVHNPMDMARFYPDKIMPRSLATDYDMLIVSTEYLNQESGVTNYANYRQGTGVRTAVELTGDIYTQYTGDTEQIKIKQCIYDYVQNHNIAFVMLIGDAGTWTERCVPDQNVYGAGIGETDDTIPADLFYSCFDGALDWNANGVDPVGQVNVDNADIYPDIAVGRLATKSYTTVADYRNKVSNYDGQVNNGTFIKNLLLSGVTLWSNGDAEIKSEKMYTMYIQPNWPDHTKVTYYDSTPGVTVDYQGLLSLINEGFNFFHMATHGWPNTWSLEEGQFSAGTAQNQLDNIPGIIATIACLTNAFDPEVPPDSGGPYDPCLGEGFIRNPEGGSIVYVGASRVGLGTANPNQHGPSFLYSDKFFQHMLQNNLDHCPGLALMQAKLDYAATADQGYNATRWVHMCLNYLGDPSIIAHVAPRHPGTTPMYRFFNTNTGGHLYTISQVERDYIIDNMPNYDYEGIKFYVYKNEHANTVACYRFLNTNTGIHLYTISTVERDYIINNMPNYNYEGVKFYVHKNQAAETTSVYRFFNTNTGGHLYTISDVERDYIMNNLPHYNYEGIKFYVYP